MLVGFYIGWTPRNFGNDLLHKIVFSINFNIVVLYGTTSEYYRSNLMFLKGVAVFWIN